MLAAQSRIIVTLEKLYGEEAINNRTFQEYKRVAEAFERDTKDNLVRKETHGYCLSLTWGIC